jgi:hypothetical protein
MFRRRQRDKKKDEAQAVSSSAEGRDPARERERVTSAAMEAARLKRLHEGAPGQAEIAHLGMGTGYLSALENITFEVDYQLSDDEGVATRWTVRGNLIDDLAGMSAHRQPVTIVGVTIAKLLRVRTPQEWTYWNIGAQ